MICPHTPESDISINNIINNKIQTPAFIYVENQLIQTIKAIKNVTEKAGCKILFSLKSFAVYDTLCLMSSLLDGFSSSSLFEARLARDILGNRGSVHITTPGIKPDEIQVLSELCDYMSFNSLSQWKRFGKIVEKKAKHGLRINPQIPFVGDERYNPCRKHSKLGIPLNTLIDDFEKDNEDYNELSGLHFHTNCESTSFVPLLKTIKYIVSKLDNILNRIEWMNLGGGYQYREIESFDPLYEAVDLLKHKYDLEIFVEPGQAVVGHNGYIVSTVLDIFNNEDRSIVILDTTVNHMPEVFEYQYRPEILNASLNGKYNYILCGSSCLAGDLFGEYGFDFPLQIGSKIIFGHMGAYTLVKAHMFNGINLPNIYTLTPEKKLILKKQFAYRDYISKWGSTADDIV